MNRKDFLKKSALGLLSVPLLNVACKNGNIFPITDYDGKVLIIGAGVAGLYAGYLLKKSGIDFQILEASDQVGGRIGKLANFADFPLDLGAQWLHGKKSVLGNFISEKSITISKDNSDVYFWFKNEFVEKLPKDVVSLFEDENLPDISFEDYAVQQGFSEEYKYLIEGIAGDQGADASTISAYWNIKEEENWSSGNADYKFKETLFDVFEKHIIPEIKENIVLNTPVRKIDYSGEFVEVSDREGNTFTTEKVLLTIPITILKEKSIQFIPQLSSEKIKAFNKIGMGAGMKVFLKFKERFYHEGIFGGEICASYADEIEGKSGNDNVLLAFIMGGQAEYLTNLGTDGAIVNTLLEELDTMYDGKATANFEKAHIQNYTSMPFIKGAYSYATVGIGNARSVAAENIENKLFFGGEAMNLKGHHQTVHGAMETAETFIKNLT